MKDKTTDNLTNHSGEVILSIQSFRDGVEICDRITEPVDAYEKVNSARLESAGRLAAWLAHKINNPLGTISGNAQLLARRLERDISDPDMLAGYMKYIETIRSQVERCAEITGEMLDFTRARDLEITSVDLAQAAKDAAELASFGRSKCNISVASGDVPAVHTDKELIVRVLYEVLANALSAVDDGDVTVDFEQGKGPDAVRIVVKDSGQGIADDVLPRIFDPFFSTRDKSRGLGLTRSLAFMHQLGGDIEVGETGQFGTTMIISLPIEGPGK